MANIHLKAYRAVLMHCSVHATMRILQQIGIAASTNSTNFNRDIEIGISKILLSSSQKKEKTIVPHLSQ
jgi:hypothetical protein